MLHGVMDSSNERRDHVWAAGRNLSVKKGSSQSKGWFHTEIEGGIYKPFVGSRLIDPSFRMDRNLADHADARDDSFIPCLCTDDRRNAVGVRERGGGPFPGRNR